VQQWGILPSSTDGASPPAATHELGQYSERSEAWYQAHVAAGGDTRAPSHMSDYVITEFGALDFGGALN